MRKLGAQPETVVRGYAARASPEGNTPVDENVSHALSCKFGCSDCDHVGLTAETTIEEQDRLVTSKRDRKGTQVIDADG